VQAAVTCEQHVEGVLRACQQVAVPEARPTFFLDGAHDEIGQLAA
jgi:hypothetical protein